MPPRNLLLCFDAFGTLFRPKQPVAQQYADVARRYGLGGFSNADVADSFRAAYKQETKQHPNFGKADGLNSEIWWTNIINNTFRPLVGSDTRLPSDLVPQLLHRFWCNEGYTLFPDALQLVHRLRDAHAAHDTKIVVGVITNSDDRVPEVLRSLGMKVSSLRYGSPADVVDDPAAQDDIEFTVMSYDVGHEKPDKRIFAAAEEVLGAIVEGGKLQTADVPYDVQDWRKVYIGDEYDKDVVGALNAGWNAVLIDRETTRGRKDVDWLDPKPPGNLEEIFKTCKAVGFASLAKLADWLPPKP